MYPYIVHTHNISYTSYTLMWFFGYLGYWGETHTTNKIKSTKQKSTFQKFFLIFFLNENDYHLQSN